MAVQTIQNSSRAGFNFTTGAVAAAGGGDKWLGNGNELLYINNGGGSPITLTLVYGTGATIDGQTLPNKTVSVPAGQAMLVGPFPVNLFQDANLYTNVTYSAVTSVTISVFQKGP
jgi:hypothetical protein